MVRQDPNSILYVPVLPGPQKPPRVVVVENRPSSPPASPIRVQNGITRRPSKRTVVGKAKTKHQPKKIQKRQNENSPNTVSATPANQINESDVHRGRNSEALLDEVGNSSDQNDRSDTMIHDTDANRGQNLPDLSANVRTEGTRFETICRGKLRSFFPCVVDHQSIIDDMVFSHVKYDAYYEEPMFLQLNNNYPIIAKESKTPTAADLRTKRIRKRGRRIYACPYCHHVFPVGGLDSVKRHMNARKERNKTYDPSCTARRSAEPAQNDSWPAAKLQPIRIRAYEL